jgi:hypothetical protein
MGFDPALLFAAELDDLLPGTGLSMKGIAHSA